ncbi:MAG TPA: cytochrome P450 [Streptosporangiaceae bacterium]
MSQPVPRMPFTLPGPFRPAAEFGVLRAEGAVSRVRTVAGHEAWLVTRYAEVRELITDKRLGSEPRPGRAGYTDQYVPDLHGWQERRNLLRPLFAARRMREFAPVVTQLAQRYVAEAARASPPADLHAAISVDYPLAVLYAFLGFPGDERRDWLMGLMRGVCDATDPERASTASRRLMAWIREMTRTWQDDPGSGALALLCQRADADAVASVTVALILGASSTTTICIDLAALLMLGDQEQWEELARRPELVVKAVEEALRMSFFGGGGVRRFAVEQIDIGGVVIRPGDEVLLDFGVANYDDIEFPEPCRFDARRAGGGHLSFGHAGRFCSGAPLARLELQALFGELTRQLPGARLAEPLESIPFQGEMFISGVARLPITWGP